MSTIATDRLVTVRRSTRRRASKRKDRRPVAVRFEMSHSLEEAESNPGTLTRTKRLIMAALRVWELKRGIRD